MKILFIVDGKLAMNHWSGTSLAIYNELNKYNELDLLNIEMDNLSKLLIKLKHKVSKNLIYPERTMRLRAYREKIISKKLEETNYDAIFCIGSLVAASIPMTSIPVYMYIDGVLSIMRDYYSSNIVDEKSYAIANQIEQIGLNKAVETDGCIFSASDWCANACLEDYGVESKFIKVVKIGANNLIDVLSEETKVDIISRRVSALQKEIRLLFIGIDWKRKGLEQAYELVRLLNNTGYCVHLDIVGADVIPPNDLYEMVTVHGRLNKSIESEREKIIELYQKNHFFIFPTHAECVGAVICESGVNALPVLANRTGGVPSLIENNQNGFLLDLNMEKWAEKIGYYKNHVEEYEKLCFESYQYYDTFLNWKSICLDMYNQMIK